MGRMGVALRIVVIIGFLAKEFGVPVRIPHLDLLAGVSGPPPSLNMIEKLDDRAWFWPTGLMAMKTPVRIVEADDLAENVAPLFLERDGSSHLTTQTAHAQDDSAWDSVRIVERDADDAFVAASGPRFVVEVVHKVAIPSRLRRRVWSPGPSLELRGG
jgi:hypothetical protein